MRWKNCAEPRRFVGQALRLPVRLPRQAMRLPYKGSVCSANDALALQGECEVRSRNGSSLMQGRIVGQALRLPVICLPRQAVRLPYKANARYDHHVGHPPRIPVWLQWEQTVVYFVTFCVADRRKVLANDKAFDVFKQALTRLKEWRVIAAVVMPDHVHLLVAPHDREAKVGNLSGAIKRWMRQGLDPDWNWQPGCFDRLLRKEESEEEKWNYMRENPVRAGLVESWEQWPYRIGFEL